MRGDLVPRISELIYELFAFVLVIIPGLPPGARWLDYSLGRQGDLQDLIHVLDRDDLELRPGRLRQIDQIL